MLYHANPLKISTALVIPIQYTIRLLLLDIQVQNIQIPKITIFLKRLQNPIKRD